MSASSWVKPVTGASYMMALATVDRAVCSNGGSGAVIDLNGKVFAARGMSAADALTRARELAKDDTSDAVWCYKAGRALGLPVVGRSAMCAAGFAVAVFAAIDALAGANIAASHTGAAIAIAAIAGISFASGVMGLQHGQSAEANVAALVGDDPIQVSHGWMAARTEP